VQFKVNTIVKAPIETCLICGTDFEVRKDWDDILYDFRVFKLTPDRSYMRCSYSIHAPFPVSDRDFYLEQLIRRDFPQPGMITLSVKSLPLNDDEYPI